MRPVINSRRLSIALSLQVGNVETLPSSTMTNKIYGENVCKEVFGPIACDVMIRVEFTGEKVGVCDKLGRKSCRVDK